MDVPWPEETTTKKIIRWKQHRDHESPARKVPTRRSALEMEASQLDAELDKKTQAKFDKAEKDGQGLRLARGTDQDRGEGEDRGAGESIQQKLVFEIRKLVPPSGVK